MNAFLRDALARHSHPFSAVLPYNLNWMMDGDPVLGATRFAPITLVDVGCRGGLPSELRSIRQLVHHIGFDADTEECARINGQPHDLHAREIFPVFVGGRDGATDFHLYRARGSSSALRPDARFVALFGDPEFNIERTVRVATTTLDTFFVSHPELPRPDMLKLDTQGTELDVLQGADGLLRTASLVEVEVEFLAMYQGQPLFHDIAAHMCTRGFDLLFLNRVTRQRNGYRGWGKGQLIFGDALFARREDRLDALDDAALMRYLVLLINYGHLDVAHQLLGSGRLAASDRAIFANYLEQRSGSWIANRVRRAVIPWIDKFLLWAMHARRHNGLAMDSDRSWPYR